MHIHAILALGGHTDRCVVEELIVWRDATILTTLYETFSVAAAVGHIVDELKAVVGVLAVAVSHAHIHSGGALHGAYGIVGTVFSARAAILARCVTAGQQTIAMIARVIAVASARDIAAGKQHIARAAVFTGIRGTEIHDPLALSALVWERAVAGVIHRHGASPIGGAKVNQAIARC